jgi:hypothetical protein
MFHDSSVEYPDVLSYRLKAGDLIVPTLMHRTGLTAVTVGNLHYRTTPDPLKQTYGKSHRFGLSGRIVTDRTIAPDGKDHL